MNAFQLLGAGLKTTAQVVLRGMFWKAVGRSLLSPPLLIILAIFIALKTKYSVPMLVPMVLSLGVAGSGILVLLGLLACLVLVVPLAARALAPAISRAVVRHLEWDMPEQPLPSLSRFVGAWLLLLFVVVLLSIPFFFVPRPFSWIVYPFIVLATSSYQVRLALAVHARAAEIGSVLSATLVQRVLLWTPVGALAAYLCDKGFAAFQGLFLSPYDLGLSISAKLFEVVSQIGSVLLFVVGLALWAALSLHALVQRQGVPGRRPAQTEPAVAGLQTVSGRARHAGPANALPGKRGVTWPVVLMALIVVLLVGAAGAWSGRLALLDYYWRATDKHYAADVAQWRDLTTSERMSHVLGLSACNGDQARIAKLIKAGLKPAVDTLSGALGCAARSGDLEMARYLLDKGADVNHVRQGASGGVFDPVTPLQFAVQSKQYAMVKYLLDAGADPSLQGDAKGGTVPAGPLHYAAASQDLGLIRTLVQAGANRNAGAPNAPIFYFMQARTSPVDDSAAAWGARATRAEQAGLVLGGVNADGSNLLHWAAGQGQLGLLEVLLMRHVDRLQQDQGGSFAFMRLGAWYQHAKVEPGPELEFMLKALANGVRDINVAGRFHQETGQGTSQLQIDWTLARVAAERPRVRALFGTQISYAALEGQSDNQRWPLHDREQATLLIADLNGVQIAAAPALARALRSKGWDDLALLAESKR